MTEVLKVGFAGIGRMGRPQAANIAKAGFPLTLWNRTRSKAEDLAAETGATVAETPAGLAGCDVIITMMADWPSTELVYAGPDGLLEALAPGKLCVDMSTLSPAQVRSLAERAAAKGAAFLDCPVSGSLALATAGTLTLMVGGDAATLERVRPILATMGSRIYHMGGIGTGATIKLAVNSIILSLGEAVSEALVLAERAGIARSTAYEVFANSAISAPFVQYRREAYERPGEVPVALRMVLAIKDLDLALGLAQEVGSPMPQAQLNRGIYQQAVTAGYADHDMSAVAEYFRRKAEQPTS
jgi:3-hydroxyisobutyrate dehydrogenase-like beta-hydroxyacid dehydrogenase